MLIRRHAVEVWHISLAVTSRLSLWIAFVCLFVCLFVGIKHEKPYFASCVGREVNPLGVITHGQMHKAEIFHVCGSYKLRGPKKVKKLTKNLYQQKLLNLSRAI